MVDPSVRDLASLTHGDHVCLPYDHSGECHDVTTPFIGDGLARGERCLYVVEDDRREALLRRLADAGINASRALERGALRLLSPGELYFRGRRGGFDPDETLAMVEALVAGALADGHTGVRGSGEVRASDRQDIPWSTMLTYEARFNERFARRPVVALCRYRRDEWPAAMVADALRTHPTAIVSGRVCRNPYYEKPDIALASHGDGDGDGARVEWMLRQLRRCADADLRTRQMTRSLADETARLAAEIQTRAAAEDELARAVALRDQFLEDLGKELAGPVAALAAELDDAAGASALGKLRAHLKRLAAVVEEIKDISRITNRRQVACVDDIDLADVARQVALRHRDRLSAVGSTVSFHAAVARVPGRWERRRLEHLIANLLANAARRGAGHAIEIAVGSDGAIALLSVRYRGRPLPSDGPASDSDSDSDSGGEGDPQITAFEHGRRTSAADPHAHLASGGLWVAREIAGAFGGTLSVASEGRGAGATTTISVELPRTRPVRRKTPLA